MRLNKEGSVSKLLRALIFPFASVGPEMVDSFFLTFLSKSSHLGLLCLVFYLQRQNQQRDTNIYIDVITFTHVI